MTLFAYPQFLLLPALQRGNLRLDEIKHVVLDEADEMLDMGFAKVAHA